jgi:TetR/AcrR family transcriptional regulator, cholesterol catabolism regulator
MSKTKNKYEDLKFFSKIQDKYLSEGFYKTSMDALASELQISKKTIYNHFPSKEKLVEAIVDDLTGKVSSAVEEIIHSDLNSIEKLVKLLRLINKYLLKFSEKWLNDLRIHMPRLWKYVDEFRTKRMYSALSVIIQQGKDEGYIIDKPNEIIITLFVSAMRSVVNPEFLYYNKFSYNEAVKLTVEILLNGILTAKGKKLIRKTLERELL